jgi:WD40 repeat protein
VPDPRPNPDAGIADRPLPPVSSAPEPRFDPEHDIEGPPVSRSSSKLPLILLLVIGGIVVLLGGAGLLVVFAAMFLWVNVSPAPAPSLAVQEDVQHDGMGDQMQPMRLEKWEQGPVGPGQFDPFLPVGCVEVSGPDEKGRLSFYHSRPVVSTAFLDDGKTLIAAGNDGQVRLWDLDPPKRKSVIPPGGRDGIMAMAVAPDGKSYVTVGQRSGVQVMDIQSKQEKAVYAASEPGPWLLGAAAYSPDGKILATAQGKEVVNLWDVKTEKLQTTLRKHKAQVSCLAFSRDGSQLASGGWDANVNLWNVADQSHLITIKAPGAGNPGIATGIAAVAFAPDGELLAFGGNDQLIQLWDLKKNEQRAALQQSEAVTSVAFSPDGRLLASASSDGMVRLWDGKTRQRRALIQTDYNGPLFGLAFSPDSKKLAVGCNGVYLWDLSKVEMLKNP